MSKGITFKKVMANKVKIGIVVTRWNAEIVQNLLAGCKEALTASGVSARDIIVVEVPGSYELPLAAQALIKQKKVAAVVALGCLIKGETMHFEYIAEAVTQGLMRINLDTQVPVIFGVLACLNEKQAIARSTGKNNHGYGWGLTAVEMVALKKSLRN